MFGTENARRHEESIRFHLPLREDEPTKREIPQAISVERKGLEPDARREMYFAVRAPIRWTL